MSREKQIKEARRWLDQAEDDLSSAEILSRNNKYAIACFLCQQSAEKGIKALYYFIDADPWGHSIIRLIEEIPLEHYRRDFLELIEHARTLDKLYIPTRYPNGLPDLTPKDAYSLKDFEIAVKSSKILIDQVKNLL
jgi:HEPN domain-containing protein